MSPLMVPTETVRLRIVKNATRTTPANAIIGTIRAIQGFGHCLHLDVPAHDWSESDMPHRGFQNGWNYTAHLDLLDPRARALLQWVCKSMKVALIHFGVGLRILKVLRSQTILLSKTSLWHEHCIFALSKKNPRGHSQREKVISSCFKSNSWFGDKKKTFQIASLKILQTVW